MTEQGSSADKRFGKRAFRYASSGRTSSLRSLVESWMSAARSLGPEAPQDIDLIVRSELALLRDRKGRSLLHLAAKSGETSMILYLLGVGLSGHVMDVKGNSAVHWLLRGHLKRQAVVKRKESKKARWTSHTERDEHSLFYTECCQLLSRLMAGRREALMTQNDDGECPTDLLQRLWRSASAADRDNGDKILMALMSSDDRIPTGVIDSQCDDDPDNHSGFGWSPEGETVEDAYSWEDYFSGFGNRDNRSHLETIAEEYVRRNKAYFAPPCKTKNSSELPQPTSEEASSDFYRRHERALFQRSQKREATLNVLPTYEQFQDEWARFTSSTQPICNLSDVTWPPVCSKITSGESRTATAEARIGRVLAFVDRSFSVLRKLQVDWHPDRFLSRVGERIDKSEVKDQIIERVNALSQLFNTSMDALRKEKGDCQQ